MNTICRLCLRDSPGMRPLFETVVGETSLIEIILSTLGVELDNSPDLPRQICQLCLKNVNSLNDFHRELIKSQTLLNQWKKGGKAVIEVVINSQEPSYNNLEHNEEVVTYNQNSSVSTEQIVIDSSSESSIYYDEFSDSIQEQIEHESIDITHELLDSDNGEMIDNETTNSNENDNRKPSLPKKRKEKEPNEVPHILFKCYICGPVLGDVVEYNYHLNSHKEMLPYQCSECTTVANPIVLTTVVTLNRHFESHGFNFVCSKCPLRYRTKSSRYYHMRSTHKEYRCQTCDASYTNYHLFRGHVRSHLTEVVIENTTPDVHKCEFCPKTYPSFESLLRHAVYHKKEKRICRWCNRTFVSVISFYKHEKRCEKEMSILTNGFH
ncbi:zinc finger protein 569-like [Toxorhynchites rutilus septentrionalis]|uniref:zinc finger protein 569-like n=1 Tax=Toxorhynchites rutilus septentrionalis TaxID=329112 RepID=UPI0024785126|nr:zinc finger protein 569-like [Toxorhynchites rutilus septentrionalis]